MINNQSRVADLTVAELREIVRSVVREVLQQERQLPSSNQQSALLDLKPLNVGEWPEGLTLRREEMYGDDGR